MSKFTRSSLARFTSAVVFTAGVVVGLTSNASGGGIPSTDALTYRGVLEDESGARLSGTYNIEIKLWNTAASGNSPLCTTGSMPQTLLNGRFSLALPDACMSAIETNADVWSDVLVDGSSFGTRTKLGASPYAIRAAKADSAASAAVAGSADGTLRAELDQLAARLRALDCPEPTAPSKFGFCIWHEDNGTRYSLSYLKAAAVCKSMNARLCTLAEVSAAQAAGAEWCAYSWVADRIDNTTAIQSFPMQSLSAGCGNVIGTVTSNRLMVDTIDANCCR